MSLKHSDFDSPFQFGIACHGQGDPIEANPYEQEKYTRGTWAFDVHLARHEWHNGWTHADRENPQQLDMFA